MLVQFGEKEAKSDLTALYSFLKREGGEGNTEIFYLVAGCVESCTRGEGHYETPLYQDGGPTLGQASCSGGGCPMTVGDYIWTMPLITLLLKCSGSWMR